ncbi:AraC family transcriptional regulator [Shewanella sp. OPT22]|nr:AraC family transcriptional regulator [Shewanella sp. OPT22]
MITEKLSSLRKNPKVLVESKLCFAASETELGIYDTFEQAQRVKLKSDQLLFCGMVTGRKVMHDDNANYESDFLPNESFVIAPNQTVEIDFPEAAIDDPTTCLAIEISMDRIHRVVEQLESASSLEREFGHWQYDHRILHINHAASTQHLLNRIVQMYTENHQDRQYMIDLAITELTVRLLREQTRNFILDYSEAVPDANGLSAVINYIHRNLDIHIDIDKLCKVAGMSRTKFFTEFKTHFNCTPAAFQLQARLKKAAELLKKNNKITTACFDSGFSDTSHFSRCFRNFYGLSPSEFREGYKSN